MKALKGSFVSYEILRKGKIMYNLDELKKMDFADLTDTELLLLADETKCGYQTRSAQAASQELLRRGKSMRLASGISQKQQFRDSLSECWD